MQKALIRVRQMGERFEGRIYYQYLAALKSCVDNACMDHARHCYARDKHIDGSLDAPAGYGEEGDGTSRYDGHAAVQWTDDVDAALDARAELQDLFHDIGRLKNKSQQKVILMTLDRHESAAIAAELGTTTNNVDQMRRRAIVALRRMRDDRSD